MLGAMPGLELWFTLAGESRKIVEATQTNEVEANAQIKRMSEVVNDMQERMLESSTEFERLTLSLNRDLQNCAEIIAVIEQSAQTMINMK